MSVVQNTLLEQKYNNITAERNKMRFWVKKHYEFDTSNEEDIEVKKTGRYVLAICDEEILEKPLSGVGTEDEEMKISKEFYGGELVEGEDIKKMIMDKNVIAINIIGENIVDFFVNEGIVNKEEVKYIGEFPHAIVFFL